jgi:hypothetical protein
MTNDSERFYCELILRFDLARFHRTTAQIGRKQLLPIETGRATERFDIFAVLFGGAAFHIFIQFG